MDNVDSGQGSKKEVRVIPVRQKLGLQTVKAVFLKFSLLLAPYDIIRSWYLPNMIISWTQLCLYAQKLHPHVIKPFCLRGWPIRSLFQTDSQLKICTKAKRNYFELLIMESYL